MSEHATTTPESESIPFSPSDLKQFDSDDAEAGRAIGKMLSLFFLYTVIAMSGAAFATYWWITHKQLN
ncbi:hypothetical protein SH661x_002385 [Planctomicrobium sp. SH661]|uniref:hypothetical protein n=1 Tax=Planctomicrobium sp. SH661 TaxID=3448124 RepID=UPI003F5B381B